MRVTSYKQARELAAALTQRPVEFYDSNGYEGRTSYLVYPANTELEGLIPAMVDKETGVAVQKPFLESNDVRRFLNDPETREVSISDD